MPRHPKSSKYLVSRCLGPLKTFSGDAWGFNYSGAIWMPIKWDKAALNPQSFNETIFTSIGGLFGAVELSEKNTKKKRLRRFFFRNILFRKSFHFGLIGSPCSKKCVPKFFFERFHANIIYLWRILEVWSKKTFKRLAAVAHLNLNDWVYHRPFLEGLITYELRCMDCPSSQMARNHLHKETPNIGNHYVNSFFRIHEFNFGEGQKQSKHTMI